MGIQVKMVIVDDDSALPVKGITGGRGLAGTVIVHKLAGSLAHNKHDLEYIYNLLQNLVVPNMRTIGMSLTTCTLPGATPSDRLIGQKMELGLGIHGESGAKQYDLPTTNAAQFVSNLLINGVLEVNEIDSSAIKQNNNNNNKIANRSQLLQVTSQDELIVLINNLGSLPNIELQIMTKEIIREMIQRNLNPVRVYVGPFMTSLDMSGLSLSILKISDTSDTNALLLKHLDSDTSAPAWIRGLPINKENFKNQIIPYNENNYISINKKIPNENLALSYGVFITIKICQKIIEIEPELTKYDQICGDGDCGLVMKAGASNIIQQLENNNNNNNAAEAASTNTATTNNNLNKDVSLLFDKIADSISQAMGGTSGIILEIFFRSMSSSISKQVFIY